MFQSKNIEKVAIAIIFVVLGFVTGRSQNDCVLPPLEESYSRTAYIFVFSVDSLLVDSVQAEIPGILPLNRTKIAMGTVPKVFKRADSDLSVCDKVVVEWDYIFERGKSYVIFSDKKIGSRFFVSKCSYSEIANDSKKFRNLFGRLCRASENDEFNIYFGGRM